MRGRERGIFCALHVDRRLNRTTTSAARHLNLDLHQPSINMDLRKSFSKPFKKLKDNLPGGRRKRDGRSGSGNDRKGYVDAEGGEASQTGSYLDSEAGIEGVMESVPSQEGCDVGGKEAVPVDDPPTSAPLISQEIITDGVPRGQLYFSSASDRSSRQHR